MNQIKNELGQWRSYETGLHIADDQYLKNQNYFKIPDEVLDKIKKDVITEGYFELPPLNWELPIDQMANLIEKLKNDGIPTTFGFVYDEYWLMYFRLHQILKKLLGDYKKLPDFWIWHVDPNKEESGWSPHRDKTRATLNGDGSPNAFTIWLPLTDSTTTNGCMYILPADRDPVYNTEREREWDIKYPDIRALPAKSGAVLGWNQAVLHWGSRASKRSKSPRISMALEFQSADRAPLNMPLMEPGYFPTFHERLMLIAKQILQYKHMYPLNPSHAEWAAGILGK